MQTIVIKPATSISDRELNEKLSTATSLNLIMIKISNNTSTKDVADALRQKTLQLASHWIWKRIL